MHAGGTALREDMNIYKIFGYLTIFRHEELGYASLKCVHAKQAKHSMAACLITVAYL